MTLWRKGCQAIVYNDLGTTDTHQHPVGPASLCTFRSREIQYNRSSQFQTGSALKGHTLTVMTA